MLIIKSRQSASLNHLSIQIKYPTCCQNGSPQHLLENLHSKAFISSSSPVNLCKRAFSYFQIVMEVPSSLYDFWVSNHNLLSCAYDGKRKKGLGIKHLSYVNLFVLSNIGIYTLLPHSYNSSEHICHFNYSYLLE